MNFFISWGYDTNGAGFQKLIEELGVKNCYYNCNEINYKKAGVNYHNIDITYMK